MSQVPQVPELRLAIQPEAKQTPRPPKTRTLRSIWKELAVGVYGKRAEYTHGGWGVLSARLRVDECAVLFHIGSYLFQA